MECRKYTGKIKLDGGFHAAGHHSVEWMGQDSSGHRVASGVYFVRLKGNGVELNQKVLLVK